MAKEVVGLIKLQIQAGQAKPAPPVGPALGQRGVNIMDFCKKFNDKTKSLEGPIPVTIKVYKDKSFDFELPTTWRLEELSPRGDPGHLFRVAAASSDGAASL